MHGHGMVLQENKPIYGIGIGRSRSNSNSASGKMRLILSLSEASPLSLSSRLVLCLSFLHVARLQLFQYFGGGVFGGQQPGTNGNRGATQYLGTY
jgi:hypothetical protein